MNELALELVHRNLGFTNSKYASEILQFSDKYNFEKFVNGHLSLDQFKNRLFCKSKFVNYTVLEDLKEKHGIILPNESYFDLE